ncbi:sigma-54 dependent transcriptional regulator [Bdellovibrio bacteriovorus]|uniref:sigma-54-dependent transcriptional regulator n=1 Tax=Bdellovibrio bacteriovorus TaxID=959 RepID=UPI0021D2A09B|nr:sigma-54 dependent transcriptional regulator [Bdellovibrio bacteriovorus]UXR63945.1 sigma-54 dependent transcriptional regulator [Bdellovibrio bacteriovorus]
MRILIVDDETLVRKTMQSQIPEPHKVLLADSMEEALEVLDRELVDLVFTDLSLDESSDRQGLQLIQEISKNYPTTVVVAMTGHDEAHLVEACMKAGAVDYLLKPFDAKTLTQVLRKAPVLHRLLRRNQTLKHQAGSRLVKHINLYTKSPAFKAVLETAKKIRGSGQSVLIRGESGSGKEIMAQYLWSLENDNSRPFIAVNCGAIPGHLAESELFGHKKGAFTGATETRAGKFESADGGDIFLDELATLSMDLQVKLLRVLSSGDIYPVGQDVGRKVNCRTIAATNENLEELIKEKKFREDLFFRIKNFTVTLPPLRERKEDILDLAQEFLRNGNYRDKHLSPEAENLLLTYSWPGNIRELKSAIEVACVLVDGSEIKPSDLTPHLVQSAPVYEEIIKSTSVAEIDEKALEGRYSHVVSEFELKLIEFALKKKGSESAAAKYLGVPRSTLGDIRRRLQGLKK